MKVTDCSLAQRTCQPGTEKERHAGLPFCGPLYLPETFRIFMDHLAHNGLVAGSSPAGPTNNSNDLADNLRSECGFIEPKRASGTLSLGSEDARLWAAVQAKKPDRIQGFHYGNRFVIRDVFRKWEAQRIWEGPDTDREAFDRQLDIERMRLAIQAYKDAPLSPPPPAGEVR